MSIVKITEDLTRLHADLVEQKMKLLVIRDGFNLDLDAVAKTIVYLRNQMNNRLSSNIAAIEHMMGEETESIGIQVKP